MSSQQKVKSYIVSSTKTRPLDLKDIASMLMLPIGGLESISKKFDNDFESINPEQTLLDCLNKVCDIYVRLISDDAGPKDANKQLMSVLTELKLLIRHKTIEALPNNPSLKRGA